MLAFSTLLHGVVSLCLALLISRSALFLTLAVLLGMMPDAVRFLQRDRSDWSRFYRWAHRTWWCYLIPFWNVHILMDVFIHKAEGGWIKSWVYWELLCWALVCGFLVFRFA